MAPSEAAERTTAPNLRLRAFREARSESRREFARALRRMAETMGENLACDERRVARWERGEVRWPRSAYRRVLSALLGVSAEDLGFRPPDDVTQAMAASSDSDPWPPVYKPPPPPTVPRRSAPGAEGPVFGPVLDLSPATLEGLESAADDLCRDYGNESVRQIIALAHKRMSLVGRLLQDGMRPADRRRLLVVCGWLSAIVGCALFDVGQRRRAETNRLAVRDLAGQAGHAELAAWALEMATWFALSEGRFSDALASAQAGEVATGDSPVAARLALHEAKAAARLRDRRLAEQALDRARAIVDRLPWPFDELHHFAMDETKMTAHAATAYLWLGDDAAAEDCAWQVLVHQLKPDGTTRHPMRIAETRCTLGILAARRRDLEQAVYFGLAALQASRVSIPTLLSRAAELEAVLTTSFPGERRTVEFADLLTAVRRQWRSSSVGANGG
jgi:transcriptional regulator with XRE-family HTH domain